MQMAISKLQNKFIVTSMLAGVYLGFLLELCEQPLCLLSLSTLASRSVSILSSQLCLCYHFPQLNCYFINSAIHPQFNLTLYCAAGRTLVE